MTVKIVVFSHIVHTSPWVLRRRRADVYVYSRDRHLALLYTKIHTRYYCTDRVQTRRVFFFLLLNKLCALYNVGQIRPRFHVATIRSNIASNDDYNFIYKLLLYAEDYTILYLP